MDNDKLIQRIHVDVSTYKNFWLPYIRSIRVKDMDEITSFKDRLINLDLRWKDGEFLHH